MPAGGFGEISQLSEERYFEKKEGKEKYIDIPINHQLVLHPPLS